MAGTFWYRLWGLLAIAHMGLLALPEITLAQAQDCNVPGRFYDSEPLLPRTSAALSNAQSVAIVALGGASTLGKAAGGTARAWPARLAVALSSRFPAARVQVVNRAVARQTAEEMAARIDRDVIVLQPTLVIWETGIADSVNGTDLDTFRQTIQTGIDRLRASGAEVLLMDMQFARQTKAIINFDEYESILREVTDANAVPLFHRYNIMHYWAEEGLFELTTADPEALLRLATHMYDCIGRAVADLIVRDSQSDVRRSAAPLESPK